MNRIFRIFFYFSLITIANVANSQLDACKSVPLYIKNKGFDPQHSYLSTTEKNVVGMELIESDRPGNPNAIVTKRFQDASWKNKGYLGAISTDQNGNSYVLPSAQVNMLLNPPQKQNTVYKVDAITGLMGDYINLPMAHLPGAKNPYGLLGGFYDCSSGNLFVSTVAGSDEHKQLGMVYSINTTTHAVKIILAEFDVYGLAVQNHQGKKMLYLASARESKVFSLELDENNISKNKLKEEFSVSGVGPRGDDKIRKIRFTQDGKMQLFTVLFYFNLTAPSEKHQSKFTYIFDAHTQQWKLEGID